MGCFNSKDPYPQNANQCQLRQSFTEYSDFPKYYKYIRRCLKFQQFKLGNPQDSTSFKQRLAAINGISTKVAKMWISYYIDYMILATWSYCLGTKSIIYPPYAIQQVARLHTCYRHNYKKFIIIITENRKQAFYFPDSLVAQQDALEYFSLRYSYNWAKNFLSDLYGNLHIRKAYKKKANLEKVWEDFDSTLIQSEFNFSFTSVLDRAEFQRKLMGYSEMVTLKNQDREEIFRVAMNIRSIFSLGELISNPKELRIPLLIAEDFGKVILSTLQKDLMRSINNLEFSMAFVNKLAWEQRISIEETFLWIREYKRFLFLSLSLIDKAQLYPSESVNQVWRLHMQFSPLYEAGILQLKLPSSEAKPKKITRSDEREGAYEKTLSAYEFYFGTPDNKIWPWVEETSRCAGHCRSYYIYFGRNCITEDQKAKTLEKYTSDNKTTETEEQREDLNKSVINDFERFLFAYMSYSIALDPDLKTKDNTMNSIDEEPILQINISKKHDDLDFDCFEESDNNHNLFCNKDCWKGDYVNFQCDIGACNCDKKH